MIRSFRNRETERVWNHQPERSFPPEIQRRAQLKMRAIDDTVEVEDLREPPGNRLEALSGNRMGQWSIRVIRQYRICFAFHDGNAFDVELTDYH